MNNICKVVWSHARQQFVAVSEIVSSTTKTHSHRTHSRSSSDNPVVASPVLSAVTLACCAYLTMGWAQHAQAQALPQGGQVVAGQGSIQTAGSVMTINQATNKLAVDWQSFSIGQGNTVNFVQPSSSAVALNRVLGTDVSVIQGALKANGQVFLLNPNGVLFTPTAQVNVGGIVASTLNLKVDDFMTGNYRFEGSSSNAIVNQGNITAGAGGSVALIAAKITNVGQINAEAGNVLIGAGSKVKLDLGGPVKIEVEQGAIDALIEQGGGIRADGGLVYLTAKAVGELTTTVINHTGLTEARTLATGEKGQIYLMGGMEKDRILVGGKLDARAISGGEGGFIETSAAKVQIAPGAQVAAGHWLIDPTDIVVDATMASTLEGQLATGDATVSTASVGTDAGNIVVNSSITWTTGRALTLSAEGNITINASVTAGNGMGSGLNLWYGQRGGSGTTYTINAPINLSSTSTFTSKQGGNIPTSYTIITSLGAQGDENSSTATTLQGLANATKLAGKFVLGADIDASLTSGWNSGAGFSPIGSSSTPFRGVLDGLGHTISGLTINLPTTNSVGFIGQTLSANIRNIGLTNVNITGLNYVGGLVGRNAGAISNSYTTGSVTGGVLLDIPAAWWVGTPINATR